MESKISISVSELKEVISDTIRTTMESMKDEKKYLTRDEVVKYLNIHPAVFAKIVRLPGFPANRIGKKYLIPKAELDIWANQQNIHCLIYPGTKAPVAKASLKELI